MKWKDMKWKDRSVKAFAFGAKSGIAKCHICGIEKGFGFEYGNFTKNMMGDTYPNDWSFKAGAFYCNTCKDKETNHE